MKKENEQQPSIYDISPTALHRAVERQDFDEVKLLISRGVDINATNDRLQTALFEHDLGWTDQADSEKLKILQYLLNHGASLNITSNTGKTPMEYLLKYGSKTTRMIVLQSKANLFHKCGPKGETALHFLLQNKKLDCDPKDEIQLLLSRGFNLNVLNNEGVSPLILAIKLGLEKPVEYLVKNGAEVNWLEIIELTPMIAMFTDKHDRNHQREHYQNVIDLILSQRGIPIHDLGKGLHKEFPISYVNRFYKEIITSHLVLDANRVRGSRCAYPLIQRITSEKCHYLENLDIYKERIALMKTIVVHGTVTLYQLLTESDDQIHKYIRNRELVLALKSLLSSKADRNLYYLSIIRKRVEDALKFAEIKKQSGNVICELTGLYMYVTEDHYVVYKILSYLSRCDILNIFEDRHVTYDNLLSIPETTDVENFATKVKTKLYQSRRCGCIQRSQLHYR